MNIASFLLLLYLTYGYLSPQQFEKGSSQILPPLYSSSIGMGKTFQGNKLTVYTLSKIKHNSLEELRGKKTILLSSEMHSRQPYSVQLLKRIFDQIVKEGSRGQWDYILERGVFLFFPFVNIDGYHSYLSSPNNKKKLRKNMNPGQTQCPTGTPGVDINRNFPSSFGTVPSSRNPCNEEYHGTQPFSEPQAKVFKEVFEMLQVVVAIDVHSYGNQWIYPYASDSTGQKIKETTLYPVYQHLVSELTKNGRKIQSCLESLNYIADGVYIDWALDQGALSLAFQVGRTFDSDSDIEDEVEQSLDDFRLVFKAGFGGLSIKSSQHTLYIQSHYLKKLALGIQIDKIVQTIQIEHNKEVSFILPDGARQALITVEGEELYQIDLTQLSQSYSSSSSPPPPDYKYEAITVILLVVIGAILLFLISFFGSLCKKKWINKRLRKRRHFYEMAEASYRGQLSSLQS